MILTLISILAVAMVSMVSQRGPGVLVMRTPVRNLELESVMSGVSGVSVMRTPVSVMIVLV